MRKLGASQIFPRMCGEMSPEGAAKRDLRGNTTRAEMDVERVFFVHRCGVLSRVLGSQQAMIR